MRLVVLRGTGRNPRETGKKGEGNGKRKTENRKKEGKQIGKEEWDGTWDSRLT